MTQTKRNLLIFKHQNTSLELNRELEAYQWNIRVAHSIDEGADLIAKHNVLIGLCLVETPQNDTYWHELMQFCDGFPKMKWVLALTNECLYDTSIYSPTLRFIAEYCHDYVIMPVDTERLQFSLGHVYGMAELSRGRYREITAFPSFDGIIGNSPSMRKLFKQIQKVSKEDYSVLIEGETGTGKELISNAIHAHSARATKPFVAINCGAFPPELIQAELFGYEKGAFTGAHACKIGRLEAAQGGTLFLDEIGDLPLAQQVNLLRFLEERTIERVGGTEKIPIDVRVISATHVDLKQAVTDGRFREDLYYRLRVLQLKAPPLRERETDIELLIWYFFEEFSKTMRRKPKGFSTEALYLLQQHDWPGNVRELMNCIRHAVIMSENRLLTPADLGLDKRARDRRIKTLEEARAEAEQETILSTLRHARNNMSRAAQNLGISRVSLYRLMEKYQLKV
ncbi:MAG: sigma 54-interacting transcriptional regulator [Gammaproteobacteria bacterium]